MRTETDVIVIGAGFSGLYAAHKFRDGLGLSVAGFEAAGGPGGTWWWNRYPGARCDIESVHYSYSFSDEIQKGWQWSEKYAAQPEILRYLEYVADKLDVRKVFTFGTRVVSTVWNEDSQRWTVTTDSGASCSARFVVAASGNLSMPKPPEFPGLEAFKGKVHATSRWPHEGVDLAGKRVGVIGTGSTGIQVIQEVAKVASHLTVFQRTPNFAGPLRNVPVPEERRKWLADHHRQVRAGTRLGFLSTPAELPQPSIHAVTPEERRARLDKLWEQGGFGILISSFADVMVDQSANDLLSSYIAERIRERVKDPRKAELLIPTDHPYGTKRAAFEQDYYDIFNQDNVDLVNLRADPILCATKNGLRTKEAEYELDIIVMATGFDAITGPLQGLGIVGRGGVRLNDYWKEGPRTYMGIAIHGFPNLFAITGPTSAAALNNNPLAIEDHVELAATMVKHTIDAGAATIEANPDAEDRWQAIVTGLLNASLFPKADSWYMGANVPGKPRSTMIFVGHACVYRAFTSELVASGFGGFTVGTEARPLPSMMKLDPSAVALMSGMLTVGAKPLHECSLDEIRQSMEGFANLQGPPRDIEVIGTSYPGAAGEMPARIYVPGGAGPHPVIVYYHGGGFIAGSLAAFDKPCRALADDLQAVVIAPGYRLAPEHPFPAAPDDAYAALLWAERVAHQYGGDAGRLLLAGESAGGTLAAAVALRARDAGGPALAGQILISPLTDCEADTESRKEFADALILTMAAVRMMIGAYIGTDTAKLKSPMASPALASSHAGLPPTLIVTVECDPLRDEAEDYGDALMASGVPVSLHRVSGLPHGAFGLAGILPRSREITQAIDSFLRPVREKSAALTA